MFAFYKMDENNKVLFRGRLIITTWKPDPVRTEQTCTVNRGESLEQLLLRSLKTE